MPMLLAEDAHQYWLEKTLFRSPEEQLTKELGQAA